MARRCKEAMNSCILCCKSAEWTRSPLDGPGTPPSIWRLSCGTCSLTYDFTRTASSLRIESDEAQRLIEITRLMFVQGKLPVIDRFADGHHVIEWAIVPQKPKPEA